MLVPVYGYEMFLQNEYKKVSGYFKKDVKLQDGNIYDVKHYDIFRENYLGNTKR